MNTRYRARTGIEYPTDPAIIRRILAGDVRPEDRALNRQVEAGEIVDDVPAVSVPWLLAQGVIEEVTDD
jgi:hypothetical protein